MNEAVKTDARSMLDRGSSLEEIVVFFHRSGVTIAESMKAFVELRLMTLGEAKAFVSSQPCWREVVTASEKLHEELEQNVHKNS